MAESTQWRLNITDNVSSSNITGAVELEFYDAVGSINTLAVGGSASSSTTNGPYTADRAFDGIKNTHGWYTANNTPSGWIQYTFATPVSVAEIELTVPSNEFGAPLQPKDFQIQYFDGSSWITESEYYDIVDWSGNIESRRFLVGSPLINVISGRCVRGSANLPAYREIFVYNMVDGEYLGYTETDQYGDFTINVSINTAVFLRIVDPDGIYSTEIRENLIPLVVSQ